MMDTRQKELQQLIHMDTGRVREAEEGVISVNRLVAHRAGVKQALVGKVGRGLVTVDNVDPLSDEDFPQQGKEGEERWPYLGLPGILPTC